MNKSILSDREWSTNDKFFENERVGWYSPRDFLRHFPSVASCELTNTTSSAGDWDGYIVQKINRRFYLIPFWQENRYPLPGYNFGTGKPLASFSKVPPDKDEIYNIIYESEV